MIENKHWKIAKNAGWIIVCKALQAILGIVLSMITTRHLGPSDYGMIQYAASITLFLGSVAQLGYTSTLVHELVSEPDAEGEILGSAILSSCFSSLICMGLIGIFVWTTNGNDKRTLYVTVAYSILLAAQGLELIQYWFQTKLLSKYKALTTLVFYLIISSVQIYVLLNHKSILWYASSKGIEHFLISAALLIVYHKLGGKSLRFSWKRTKKMVIESRYYILSALMVMTFSQADRIMIKNMMGNAAMGYYSAAVVCANSTEFIFLAVIESFRPVIFKSHMEDIRRFEKQMSQLYSLIIYTALAQSVLITMFSEFVVRILCGPQYGPSVSVLRILVWYTAFSYIGIARDIWILAENRQKILWKVNLIGAVANILMNLCLMPRWGISGAAFASLITQILVNVGLGYVLKPIRGSNKLLASACNPKMLLEVFRKTDS